MEYILYAKHLLALTSINPIPVLIMRTNCSTHFAGQGLGVPEALSPWHH